LSKPITLAFAGSADVDLDNIKALLNDWLGFGDEDADGYPAPSDREINLIFPITKTHLSDGLEAVLNWSEYVDLPFVAVTDGEKSRALDKILRAADSTATASNVTSKVVDLLEAAEGEKYLVLLWGEDGSEEAELLLDAADQVGIKAKDLTAGLDDISFGEPEAAEEPEPEPEPEPEEPKRGRRRGRRAEPEEAQPEEEPLTEDEPEEPKDEPAPKRSRRSRKPEPEVDPVEEDLEQQVNRAAQKAQRDATPSSETEIDLPLVRAALEAAYTVLRLEDERNAVINQADVRERPLTELLRKALHTLGEDPAKGEGYKALAAQQKDEEEQEEPTGRRRRGRPRDESKTFAFLVDEKGNYSRRGRGRIPAGQKVVQLTRAEIEEKGLDIDGE
jgi:hypothetical protein